MPSRALQVSVEDVSGCGTAPEARCFTRWLRRAFEEELSGELAIRIVGEEEGRALNRRYRGRSSATNVLSFAGSDLPADASEDIPKHLGDLVLCAPVVEREAREQGKASEAHWAHLAIHGVLHLLGFDHEADADAQIMERRETELLIKLGFDDPYEHAR